MKRNFFLFVQRSSNDKKIKFVWLKKNRGAAYCRNLAIKKSKSKYLAFIDSDDIWEKNKLKFSDEPEPENELDSLLDMLDGLMDDNDDLTEIESDGKAPTYKGSQLKSNNEKSNIKGGTYNVNNENTKSPVDSRSQIKTGSYGGVANGTLNRKQDSKVIRKYIKTF